MFASKGIDFLAISLWSSLLKNTDMADVDFKLEPHVLVVVAN